ncbi:hypothetical protein [Sphingomonas sp. 2R-10]|uniref:hypothetical protein n=1 Tax=Sphingomonas sp. 2R-10 TaxID=3045148 RepID=UPI0024BAE26A|nr:hypothetical protein [Sphingomonas sp. 2R-10]
MNVGVTRNAYMAKYLYAGGAAAPPRKPATDAGPQGTTRPTAAGVTVQISDQAKAAQSALQNTSASETVKSKVNSLYEEVRTRGSSVTFDTSLPGELLDVSSLTDDDLAKIAVDREGAFSKELSDYATGALAARMKVSLEPYENNVFSGDRRGHAMTINKLYDQMSPDTRIALGWTPAMMASNNRMLEGDTRLFGKFDEDIVMSNLFAATRQGGLSFAVNKAG